MLRRILPPIRVHCWGGFGSQLFSLALCWKLSRKFPYRRIALYLHSSGVTKRVPEIQGLQGDLKLVFLDDYITNRKSLGYSGQPDTLKSLSKNVLIDFSKTFLIRCGFLSTLDRVSDYRILKPWLVSTRGHYTDIPLELIDLARLKLLIEGLSDSLTTPSLIENSLTIQYRLGDLIHLDQKGFITAPSISTLITHELTKHKFSSVLVLTDSRDQAKVFLDELKIDCRVDTLSPISTLNSCIESKFFIGTNSKISLWGALFRALEEKRSQLPYAFKEKVCLYLSPDLASLISYYGEEIS